MNVKIYENGQLVNRIVADADFVAAYCAENGYTYEVEPESAQAMTAPLRECSSEDLLDVLLGLDGPGNEEVGAG